MSAGVRNTAIKRIQGDVREMMTNPSDQYAAAPLDTNMFDWHFTLRGPRDTEFEGGVYHGRIILPSDYPFKPPNIMLLTPNGRFEVRKKICLSISAYHPEEWQPAWGVRLILEALISFMPTKGEGAIGALDFSAAERKRLAKLSIDYTCETCGRVLDLLPELRATNADEDAAKKPSKYAEQIAQLHMHSLESAPPVTANDQEKDVTTMVDAISKQEECESADSEQSAIKERQPIEIKPTGTEKASATTSGAEISSHIAPTNQESVETVATEAAPEVLDVHQTVDTPLAVQNNTQAREPDSVDIFLHYLTVGIVVALFALVYKKLLQTYGVLQ
ncbi:ubiquitin-conjugating enzyme [Plasmopara halstedii]|uniref:Ubiquitin-conjugating enzyme n=1 Tax=Plasmopara halstedii TaxID=4781 RepID=A0A0P1B4T1_PLAHL|nr:ubiquitin-conjugating enzyme [Plasmopara halstedii]CEG48657.1 ubiquitin-conjugating enzyme [Plasmopara halstedii]|eukprot:XP_024585026.1 ubiquitin-conjugating enzyme [Plasmopara halstedii]